jgi:hypothetical protein
MYALVKSKKVRKGEKEGETEEEEKKSEVR